MMGGFLILATAPWRFEHPAALLMLIGVPLVALLMWWAHARGRAAFRLIAGHAPQQSRTSTGMSLARIVVQSLGLTFLIVAIARPQADPVEESVTVRGRDIVFVVDVSRSMLSQDVVPSRLGRTKIWINDLINTLKGDRVGLVAFAGVPIVKCPLTLDMNFFRMELDELSPASVPRGGTLIGDAIRKTMSAVFEANPGRYRDIILITDGEDQGSYPAEAAKAAAELGVRIIAIGIGSELEGAPVPAEGSNAFIEHEGTAVRSRMDGSTLAAIAQSASAVVGSSAASVFLNVGTGTMDLDQVYQDLIASAEQRDTESKASVSYRELFPIFLAAALTCLCIDPLIRRRTLAPSTSRRASSSRAASVAAAIALVAVLLNPPNAVAQSAPESSASPPTTNSPTADTRPPTPVKPDPAALYNSGRELFKAGKFAEAADRFKAADLGSTDAQLTASTRFNLGLSLLKQATTPPATAASTPDQAAAPDPATQALAHLESAVRAFRSALAADPGDEQAARNIEIARRMIKEMQDAKKKSEQRDGKENQSGEGGKQQDGSQKQDGKEQEGSSPKEQEAKERQEQADELNNLAKEQSKAAATSGEAQKERDQEAAKQKAEQSKEQQQEVSSKTQSQQERAESKETKPSDATKEAIDEARREQEKASEALKKDDVGAAKEHQERAAEALQKAAQEEQKAAEQAREEAKQERQNEQAAKQAKDKSAKDTPKYDQAAAQSLDKERKQREARQQMLRALRGKPVQVERDW